MSDPSQDLPHEIIGHDASEGPAVRRSFRKRRLFLLPLLLSLLFAGGIIGLYFQPPGLQAFFRAFGLEPGAGSDAPFALPPDVDLPEGVSQSLIATDVIGLARLMPSGDVSIVAPPFGAGDARISEILVSEGDAVEAGDRLAVLDNLPSLEAARRSAEATVALREASLAQTRSAVRRSTEEAQASLAEAVAAADAAAADLERTERLLDRGVATQATLDQVKAAARQAEEAVSRAEATLARYAATPIDEQPDVIVAERNLDAAEIELARAEADLARAYVTAPIAGTVLSVDARPGQNAAGGLMQIGAIDTMMAEVEVYQDRIGEVEVGQPVELIAEALDRIMTGEVARIGLLVQRQEIVSADIAANTDARVVEVMVALDPALSRGARRFTNLEVIARIDTRPPGGGSAGAARE